MSRNPYLTSARPSTSYTRSSRTSSKGSSLLGRSRSSATLGGLFSMSSSNIYSSPSSYIPSSTTSSWQRSTSTSRLTRQGSDISSKTDQSSNDEKTYSNYLSRPVYKSTSSHNLAYTRDNVEIKQEQDDENHLQNYQQSKFVKDAKGSSNLSSRSSIDETKDEVENSTTSDSTNTKLSFDESDSIRSGSASKQYKQGNLMKTQSLDAGKQALDTTVLLSGTMSVDRLLLRSESMTERELRKSYKELVLENEKLKKHLKGFDDRDKQRQQDWIRKERQLERKISELEEENKQLEQWRIESQRLKDENSSLIRVLSKISKKHN